MPFADGLHRDVSEAKYAIYHYARIRFNVVSAKGAPREPHDTAWLLRTSRATGIFVTLTRLSGPSGKNGRTGRAFGYSVLPDTSAATGAELRGLSETSTPLEDGRLLSIRRLCGDVPADEVFEPQRPELVLGNGFSLPGPAGYSSLERSGRPIVLHANGADSSYSKLLMQSRGSLYVTPTACPSGFVDIAADFVTGSTATVIVSIQGRTYRYLVSPTPSRNTLSYRFHTRAPFRIDFSTDAPVADFNPILFRYEHDVPRELRLVMQPFEISERAASPPAAIRAKRADGAK